MATGLLSARPFRPRPRGLQLLAREDAIIVDVKLVEQRHRPGGEFGEIHIAIMVPVHQRRGGGPLFRPARLIDGANLILVQPAVMIGIVARELGPKARLDFAPGEDAVVIRVEAHQRLDGGPERRCLRFGPVAPAGAARREQHRAEPERKGDHISHGRDVDTAPDQGQARLCRETSSIENKRRMVGGEGFEPPTLSV